MARKYQLLKYDDRKVIEEMCRNGEAIKQIAARLQVHRDTIYREIRRSGVDIKNRENYRADVAQLKI